jgi:hypothetical protein
MTCAAARRAGLPRLEMRAALTAHRSKKRSAPGGLGEASECTERSAEPWGWGSAP